MRLAGRVSGEGVGRDALGRGLGSRETSPVCIGIRVTLYAFIQHALGFHEVADHNHSDSPYVADTMIILTVRGSWCCWRAVGMIAFVFPMAGWGFALGIAAGAPLMKLKLVGFLRLLCTIP